MLACAARCAIGKCAQSSTQGVVVFSRRCSTPARGTKVSRAGSYALLGATSCLLAGGTIYFWDQIKPHLEVPVAREKAQPPAVEPISHSSTEFIAPHTPAAQPHGTILPRDKPYSTLPAPITPEVSAVTSTIPPQEATVVSPPPTEASTIFPPLPPPPPPPEATTVSPPLLEAIKEASRESVGVVVNELQHNIDERLGKVSTTILQTESQIASVQEHVAGLTSRLEQAIMNNQQSRAQENQAFQDVLLIQENTFQLRLDKAVQEERVRFEKQLESRLQEVEQQYQASLQQKVEEEKSALQETYESHYRQQYLDLNNHFRNDLSRSLGDFESFLLKREQEVLAQYKRHHTEQLQTLHKHNDKLASVNSALANANKDLLDSSKTHSMCVAIFGLANTLASPFQCSFSAELAALRAAAQGDGVVEVLLLPLEQLSTSGVSSYSQLRERFRAVAQSGRQAALVPEEGGIVGNIVAAVASRLIIPEKGLVDGDGAEALFANAEYYLDKGDLGSAVAHLEKLRGMPASVARDWVVAAKEKLVAEQTLNALQAHVASLYVGNKGVQQQAQW